MPTHRIGGGGREEGRMDTLIVVANESSHEEAEANSPKIIINKSRSSTIRGQKLYRYTQNNNNRHKSGLRMQKVFFYY